MDFKVIKGIIKNTRLICKMKNKKSLFCRTYVMKNKKAQIMMTEL